MEWLTRAFLEVLLQFILLLAGEEEYYISKQVNLRVDKEYVFIHLYASKKQQYKQYVFSWDYCMAH